MPWKLSRSNLWHSSSHSSYRQIIMLEKFSHLDFNVLHLKTMAVRSECLHFSCIIICLQLVWVVKKWWHWKGVGGIKSHGDVIYGRTRALGGFQSLWANHRTRKRVRILPLWFLLLSLAIWQCPRRKEFVGFWLGNNVSISVFCPDCGYHFRLGAWKT